MRPRAFGLGAMLGGLLSVAMLPIGLISIFQTYRAMDEARSLSESALLGRTAEAAAVQRQMIQNAFAVADVLGLAVIKARDGGDECSQLFTEYVKLSPDIVFAGFVGVDGRLGCGSSMVGADIGSSPVLQRALADPRPTVDVSPTGRVSGLPVLIVLQPVFKETRLMGFVVLSTPNRVIAEHDGALPADAEMTLARGGAQPIEHGGESRPVALAIFNHEGQILAADMSPEAVAALLPSGVALRDLVGDPAMSFSARNRAGQVRVFAVSPIVPDRVYAIGSWQPESTLIHSSGGAALAMLFPAMMWLTGLAVAYFAVHRLAIRHVRSIARRMRAFAGGERRAEPLELTDAPQELRAAADSFNARVEIVTRQETAREEALHEKTVLLKEVHHRVKNNLQLIASIINMQIRTARTPEAQRLLRRIQERVIGLATVHRRLYTSPTLSSVRADSLISELVDRLTAMSAPPDAGIRVETDLEAIELYPDQALPLSLLVAEASTNAVKHLGAGPDGPWIRVSLKKSGESDAALVVTNSRGVPLEPAEDAESDAAAGLGAQLIDAFTAQLDAESEREETEDHYSLSIRFSLQGFIPED